MVDVYIKIFSKDIPDESFFSRFKIQFEKDIGELFHSIIPRVLDICESINEKLHEFIEDNGYEKTDQQHEIYLNDHRRVVPEKLKTIIRQPMKKI